MAQPGKAKAKILYLLKILQEETDAEHGMTMSQIIGRLAEYGVSAERKSIYSDIKVLRAFDIDVKTYQRNPVEYAIDKHGFTLNELMLLVDAVQSCRAITDKQARSLVTNIKTLASNAEREKLDRLIHVVGRIGSNSESVLGAVDLIHEAMRNSRKISFSYSKRGPDGNRLVSDEDGKHTATPISITYDDGFYYLTAWNEDTEKIREYRLDRMASLNVLDDEPAAKNEAISKHRDECSDATAFGRFIGNETMVTLAVSEEKAEIIFDRFGRNTSFSPVENGEARAHVRVCVSDQFFGWVAGMNKQVRIVGPTKVVDRYRAYLESLLED